MHTSLPSSTAPAGFIPLEAISVATPCRADWNAMHGDEQARFCQSCEKHVYNLSGMTRAEAESLIRSREGAVCIRLSRRADGTVITDDCPVGLRRVRNASRRAGRLVIQPVRWTFSKAAMVLAPLLLVGGTLWAKSDGARSCGRSIVQTWPLRLLSSQPEPMVMGMMVRPAPVPADPVDESEADEG